MNSLLQQLFMIPSFRESIKGSPDAKFKEQQVEDNVLFQLKVVTLSLNIFLLNPMLISVFLTDWYTRKKGISPREDFHLPSKSLMVLLLI